MEKELRRADDFLIVDLDKKKDTKQIIELHKNNQDSLQPLTEALRHISTCAYMKGIFDEGKLISMILVEENENKEGYINNLVTDHAYTSIGLASRLLEETKKEYNYLKLDVAEENDIAFKIYKKMGFLETSGYYDLLSKKWFLMEWSAIKPKMKVIRVKHEKYIASSNKLKERTNMNI